EFFRFCFLRTPLLLHGFLLLFPDGLSGAVVLRACFGIGRRARVKTEEPPSMSPFPSALPITLVQAAFRGVSPIFKIRSLRRGGTKQWHKEVVVHLVEVT